MHQSTTQQKIADKEMSEIVRLQKEVERLKSAVDELTVLNELAIAAGRASELDEMLDLIVEKSIKAVKAEQGSILLVTEQKDKPLQTLIRQINGLQSGYSYHGLGTKAPSTVIGGSSRGR